MLKISKIISLIFLLLIFYCNKEKLPPDFRNVRWGMSVDEVKSMENEAQLVEIIKNKKILYKYNNDTLFVNKLKKLLFKYNLPKTYSDLALVYDWKVEIEDTHSCNIIYFFKDNKMVASAYWIKFESKFATMNNEELNKFLETLKIKYGLPDDTSRGGFHSDEKAWDGKEGDIFKWYTDRTFIETLIEYSGIRLLYRSREFEKRKNF